MSYLCSGRFAIYLAMKTNLLRRIGRAFTLLELLVVMSIIGILATVGLRGMAAAKEFARRAQAHTDCLNFQASLDTYLTDRSNFPLA